MVLKFMRWRFSSSFGKYISPFEPNKDDNKHNLPASSWVKKYLLMSFGALIGWFFPSLEINPSNRLPFEKATFANLAEENLFISKIEEIEDELLNSN